MYFWTVRNDENLRSNNMPPTHRGQKTISTICAISTHLSNRKEALSWSPVLCCLLIHFDYTGFFSPKSIAAYQKRCSCRFRIHITSHLHVFPTVVIKCSGVLSGIDYSILKPIGVDRFVQQITLNKERPKSG